MPLNPAFPADPYAILSPDVRWYPGDAMLGDIGREKLIPPLVDKGVETDIFDSQIPGGMISNMESQLKAQGAGDRLRERSAVAKILE